MSGNKNIRRGYYYFKPSPTLDDKTNEDLKVKGEVIVNAFSKAKLRYLIKEKDRDKFEGNIFTPFKVERHDCNSLTRKDIIEYARYLGCAEAIIKSLDITSEENLIDLLYDIAKNYINMIDSHTPEPSRTEDIKTGTNGILICEPEKRLEQMETVTTKRHPRDDEKSLSAIKNAQHLCEFDCGHKLFLSSVTKKNYVEAHHLVPLEFYYDFDYSLDIIENIVSLCVVCHKKLHHAIFEEKKDLINKLYTLRKELLASKCINISIEKLYEYYGNELDD